MTSMANILANLCMEQVDQIYKLVNNGLSRGWKHIINIATTYLCQVSIYVYVNIVEESRGSVVNVILLAR